MRGRILITIALIAAVLLFIARIHGYLAVDAPSGSRVLVVEGWLHDEQLAMTAEIITSGDIERVYITGTLRPFDHYLGADDTLRIRLKAPFSGTIDLDITGVDSGGFTLEGNGRPLIADRLSAGSRSHRVELDTEVTELLLWSSALPGHGLNSDNLLVLDLRLDGRNVYEGMDKGWIAHGDGTISRTEADHAAHARGILVSHGVPPAMIVAAQTDTRTGKRSWTMARHVVSNLKSDGISDFDIVTMGVHGRRSRVLFRKACGSGCQVGVISLEDPMVPAKGWWKMIAGWFLVIKELAGLAIASLFPSA